MHLPAIKKETSRAVRREGDLLRLAGDIWSLGTAKSFRFLQTAASSHYSFEICFFCKLKVYYFSVHFSPVRDAGVTWRWGHCSGSFLPLITAPGGILHPHRSPAVLSGGDGCGCPFLKWLSRKKRSATFLLCSGGGGGGCGSWKQLQQHSPSLCVCMQQGL